MFTQKRKAEETMVTDDSKKRKISEDFSGDETDNKSETSVDVQIETKPKGVLLGPKEVHDWIDSIFQEIEAEEQERLEIWRNSKEFSFMMKSIKMIERGQVTDDVKLNK
jgi:hypothetical protein